MKLRLHLFRFFTLCIAIVSSCKKESTNPVSLLMSHTWYPYQTRIIATDTTTITERNISTGIQTVRKYSYKWDTTFLNSSCQQQSALRFQQGGTYLVSNKCSAISSDFTGQWFILPSNASIIRATVPLSSFPPPAGYPAFALGDISNSSITNSQFIFFNYSHLLIDMASIGLQYDSLVVKDTATYLTCKSQ